MLFVFDASLFDFGHESHVPIAEHCWRQWFGRVIEYFNVVQSVLSKQIRLEPDSYHQGDDKRASKLYLGFDLCAGLDNGVDVEVLAISVSVQWARREETL